MAARPRTRFDDPELYINRELSWLEFNARVLALAEDPSVPVLDRCMFLAIFSSNLDEFFMVRVAGHQDAYEAQRPTSSPDGLDRLSILEGIAARVRELLARQSAVWREDIAPELDAIGSGIRSISDLTRGQKHSLITGFTEQILPALTPLAPAPGHDIPYVAGLSLNLAANVVGKGESAGRFAYIPIPAGVDRLIPVDGGYVLLEDVVRHELHQLFPGMSVEPTGLFRVTRDADFNISDDADDLLDAVRSHVRSRRFGDVVRIEFDEHASDVTMERIRGDLRAARRDVFQISAPLDMTALWRLIHDGPQANRRETWQPVVHPRLRTQSGPADMFAVIRDQDLFVHHPFDDFETSVARFIDQAADDPDVIAIKLTIYRTSGDTPIVPALIRAAEAGMSVACLVEVQARFDEERNITWGRKLARAGVHVVYGQPGRKTHAKLALVVRREGARMRRYAHIGTGNYHPATARLYTDFGLFTCRADITREVHSLFNYLTGYSEIPQFRRLLVAPAHMRDRIIRRIRQVAAAHRRGFPGRIVMKMNAIIDGPVIRALYAASQDGVPIELYVRSICGLRPGVPGVSETITVRSVVGQFLEHTRLCAFTSGDTTRFMIGSADMMERNLDNRMEVMTPVDDPDACAELQGILDLYRTDTELSWTLDASGTWSPPPDDLGRGLNVHEELKQRAIDA